MIEDVGVSFAGDGPGEILKIAAWRLRGRGDGPVVHLQAGVHADEIPGMLVLHKLWPRLVQAAEQGRLKGTITVVPQANPLGLRQFRQGRLLGRFHEATAQNFNRHFLTSAEGQGTTAFSAWQKALVALAADADLMLDLHCDDEALSYLYLHQGFWPIGQDLAAALGSDVVILWDESASDAFEEVALAPWAAEAAAGGRGFAGRISATVELRGQGDVTDAFADHDAEGLYRFLCARGVIDEPADLPVWTGAAVPMAHMETVMAPEAGLVVFTKDLGDHVAAGEVFARLYPNPGPLAREILLTAPQAGRLVTRQRDRLIGKGAIVAKFTGSGPSSTWVSGPLDP